MGKPPCLVHGGFLHFRGRYYGGPMSEKFFGECVVRSVRAGEWAAVKELRHTPRGSLCLFLPVNIKKGRTAQAAAAEKPFSE